MYRCAVFVLIQSLQVIFALLAKEAFMHIKVKALGQIENRPGTTVVCGIRYIIIVLF